MGPATLTPSISSPRVDRTIPIPPLPVPAVGAAAQPSAIESPLIEINSLSVFYGQNEAIKKVSLRIPEHRVVAFIGPSGCGKSTLLRSINRLNDLIPGCRVTGQLRIGGADVYDPKIDLVNLRRQVGLVFQKPNPFPKSIYDNIAYGPKLQG